MTLPNDEPSMCGRSVQLTLLNIVVSKCPPILKLLAREDEPLLIRRDT